MLYLKKCGADFVFCGESSFLAEQNTKPAGAFFLFEFILFEAIQRLGGEPPVFQDRIRLVAIFSIGKPIKLT